MSTNDRKRSCKSRAMADAELRGDRESIRRVMRWKSGGRLPHHKHLQAARKTAFGSGHLLERFRPGPDEDEYPEIYGTWCRFCGGTVIVARDLETREWRAAGLPLNGTPCPRSR